MSDIIAASTIVTHYRDFQEKKLRKKDKTVEKLEQLFNTSWLGHRIIMNHGEKDKTSTELQKKEISLAIAEILK